MDEKHQEVARKAFPILIELAKARKTITYGELADKLGISPHEYPMPQMLGSIVTTLTQFGEEWNEEFPHLTVLVVKVVDDIIENMSEADKANVVNTPEVSDLIQFHYGWGTAIRNDYNL